jgi:ribonuclease HI
LNHDFVVRNDVQRLRVIDPDTLSRDELIALVRQLQNALGGNTAPLVATQRSSPLADPEADFTLVFDGGSLGNPGRGYGSFEIVTRDGSLAGRQIEFGDNMTNNQAEFLALIAGLKELLAIVGANAGTHSLVVRGDSQLVIRGLSGAWKIKHAGLRPLYDEASNLLKRFGSVELTWQPRRESVKAFGH